MEMGGGFLFSSGIAPIVRTTAITIRLGFGYFSTGESGQINSANP
jgi:hypothetical protein